MRNPRIIVVGATRGLSAHQDRGDGRPASTFLDFPVKRSHSVSPSGINAAKNLKGEGDSTWQHFDTPFTVEFSRQPAAGEEMCDAAPGIIDLLDRMGLRSTGRRKGCSTSAALAHIVQPHALLVLHGSNCSMRSRQCGATNPRQ